MLAEGRDVDPISGEPGTPRTTRRSFLGKAAGAVAISAAVAGGVEAAPTQTLSAQEHATPRLRGFHNVNDFGACGNGVADDTGAIQSAIAAAQQSAYGGVVFLPIGQYVVSSPLVITRSDILILGSGPLATMGGAGQNDGKCTTIKPAAKWAQGRASQPACILFDAVTAGAGLSRCGVERLTILGSNLPLECQMHGIATYGYVGAFNVTGCIVGSIANKSSSGITNTAGYWPTAQGNSIVRNLVQDVGGNGFDLASGDLTMEHCHAQGCGGNGVSITTRAGDTRLANCRSDLSGLNGFYINVPHGGYLGMVQLANCSTQRNIESGILIANTTSGEISPVYLTGCVFQGDGRGGSSHAGIRLAGPVIATITGCGVHVNTCDIHSGVPLHAIAVASDGISPPVMLSMLGGFYNAITAFCAKANAPITADIRVYTYTGSQWKYDKTPTLTTQL